MPTSLDILDALYGATKSPIRVTLGSHNDPDQYVTDPEFFKANEGKIMISPRTEAGIVFVFGCDMESERDSWEGARLKPTAAFFNGKNTTILIWAFDAPVSDADAAPLADALDMAEIDEFIPLPPKGEWECVHCDPNVYYALSDLQSAYCAKATTASKTLAKYHDAVCLTPYDENDPRYKQEMTISVGGNKDSMNWRADTMPIHTFIMRLADHREGKKDGPAFVTGSMVGGRRVKVAMKAQYAAGIDIDTGTSSEQIDKALLELNCLAVRYTTHSHFKTKTEFKKDTVIKFLGEEDYENDDVLRRFLREKEQWDEAIVQTAKYAGTDHTERGIMVFVEHAPMPKHRIVIPFATPFVVADEGAKQTDAMEKWTKIPTALAEKLGVPLDKTGTDPSRLFYFPRHAVNRPFEITIVGGELFDWHSLELDNPFDQMVNEVSKGSKNSKSKTEEGKALGRWSMKAAHGFQIVDVIEANCPDKIRSKASSGVNIECPFDEDHSNAGDPDDQACFAVNAGEGSTDWFTISCRHDTCRDKTMLDMLGKMLKDGWFSRDALDNESFNAAEVEDTPQSEQADDAVRVAIRNLSEESTLADVEKVIMVIIDSGIPEGRVQVALADIIEHTGGRKSAFQKKTLSALLKDAREANAKGQKQAPNSETQKLKDALSKSLGREFVFPPPHLGNFSLRHVGGKTWLCRSGSDDDRISTPFVLTGGVVYADRRQKRALRVEVFNQDNKWVSVEIDAGDLATLTGVDALRKLMAAGLAPTSFGKQAVIAYLTESQPCGPSVYDCAGFHGDAFICPTGEVLPTNAKIELAVEKRLKCQATNGSFEDWRSAVAKIFELPIADAFLFHTGILMGLAGTLANLADDETVMYDCAGETTTGKTTAGALAVAHWCKPDLKEGKGLLLAAKGTDNSQEAVFEKCTGCVVALDEFGQLPAKMQHDVIFMGQAGTGKRRLDANSEEKRTRGWRGGCLILSSEKGIAARLRQEGVKMPGGLLARVLQISTDHAKKLDSDQFAHIEKAIKNYGWSGPAFVRALNDLGHVKQRGELRDKIVGLVNSLRDTTGPENAYRRRAARQVAYLWAAGLIAQDAGLIPDDYDLEGLATKVWDDALQSDSGPTDPNERAWNNLVDQITARKDVDIVALKVTGDERRYREAIGYYDDLEGRYIIRAMKFDELSGDTVSGRAFRKFLDAKGRLIKQGENRTWSGYPGLGKDAQYVVLHMEKIDG